MPATMPSRRIPRNVATAASERPRLAILATREINGATVTLLADPAFRGTIEQAVRHARFLANTLAERFACNVDAVVLDIDSNVPLFFAEAAAPAVVRVGEPDAVFSGLKCSVCGWHLRPVDGTTCKPCGAELSARLVAWARTLPIEAMVQAAYAKHLASQGGAS